MPDNYKADYCLTNSRAIHGVGVLIKCAYDNGKKGNVVYRDMLLREAQEMLNNTIKRIESGKEKNEEKEIEEKNG